jgi:hypothetical protein
MAWQPKLMAGQGQVSHLIELLNCYAKEKIFL